MTFTRCGSARRPDGWRGKPLASGRAAPASRRTARHKESDPMTQLQMTRRAFLRGSAGAAGMAVLGGVDAWGAPKSPAAPVAIARCRAYDPAQVQAQMAAMFHQIGGIRRLVQGKSVAVKLNL